MFDLTADLTNAEHMEPTNGGSLQAEVRFSDQLLHAVTCFVHAECNNCIEISLFPHYKECLVCLL